MKKAAILSAIFFVFLETGVFAFSMRSGYYVGSGTARSITGIGITPDLVIIKADAAVSEPVWRSSAMTGDTTAYFSSAAANFSNGITSLDSDGFSLGTNYTVNYPNIRYTWTAFSGSGGNDFKVGSYIGNGTGNTNLDIVGFQPDLVWIKSSGAAAGCFRTSTVSGDNTLFFGATNQAANYIQELRPSGFQVGTSASVNSNGVTYWYVAFKKVSGSMEVGSYTGDGADNRSISEVGFQPDLVMIKQATSGTAQSATMRSNQSYGDESHIFTAAANALNHIQALESNGFQIGTDAKVNSSGSTYHYAAFKGVPAPTTPSGSFKMANGSYIGNGSSQSISGLGFTPDLLIIKGADANSAVFATSLMAPNYTAYLAAAATLFTGAITSLDSDGFSIGSHITVNNSDVVYRWVAFGNSGSADFKVGAYTGTGGDDRPISGVGFTPDVVAVKGNTTTLGVWRNSAMAGDTTAYFSSTADTANRIQALQSDGFQIGTDAQANTSAVTYFYFAFKDTSGKSKNSSYTGDGNDNRSITGTGFLPSLLWIKQTGAVAGVLREGTISGDNSQFFTNAANASNNIQSLEDDGFQVGTAIGVNSAATIYRYAAWRGTAAASKLGFTVQPSNTAAGATITPAVKVAVQDQYGQTITDDNSTQVTIALGTNPSGGTLSGTLTKTVSSGIATFDNLSINLTGAGYTLAASTSGLPAATSNSFNITPASSSKLRYISQPTSTQAGANISPVTVEVLDASNNRVTDDNFTQITMSILNNPGSATLDGTVSKTVSSGVATFSDLNIDIAGTGYTLRASAAGLTSADSDAFNITPASASKLAFIVQPSNTAVGSSISPAVRVAVEDQFGNIVTSDSATGVTILIGTNPGGGTLSGTTTKTVSSGLATFENLSIDKPGDGYTLLASASGLTSGSSSSFNVISNVLEFIVQPSNSAAGSVITPEVKVAIKDLSGNVRTSDNSTPVTVALDSSPGGGTLAGTLTRVATSGVATFNDLRIDKAGNGYIFRATAPVSTPTTSEPFNIIGELPSLEILSFSPSADAIGVSPETAVSATFSTTMNKTSVENAFSLKAILDRSGASVEIPVSGSFFWNGNTVTFTPALALTKGYTYQAAITDTAQDLFGNVLPSTEIWSFTTILDKGSNNVVIGDDGKTKVVFSKNSLPVDFFLRISTDPVNQPIVVNPATISAANAKTAAEGNPFKHPVTGTAREFVLYHADTGSRITDTLSQDADLIIPYPDADSDGIVDGTSPPIRAADLLIYRLDESNDLWFRVPNSTVNTMSKYVTAPVKSFSTFTLMATPATTLSDAYAFPNPFRPANGHTTVTFTNLASQCTIKVFTLSGDLVKTIQETDGDGKSAWDVKNDAGQPLQSGLYFYVIKSASDIKMGKLVIIR